MPDILTCLNQPEFELKLKAGDFYHKVKFTVKGKSLQLDFPYNADLLAIVKSQFGGRRWLGFDDGPKAWSIPITPRNMFRLNHLQGKYASSPYARFDELSKTSLVDEVKKYAESRSLPVYTHQINMINLGLITRQFIWAAEMGTGKTLAAIILMEMSGLKKWYWIGPRSALVAAKLDFRKWKCKVEPLFLTYEGLRDVVENWKVGLEAPQGVIFDEASKVKTPSSKRTLAAQHLADAIRKEHTNGVVGLLSGTPAPKSPIDWWSLSEIACPGFVREGNIASFTERLAITEKKETIPGAGGYTAVVGWRDNDQKCNQCGKLKDDLVHRGVGTTVHTFKPSKNEVAGLSKSLSGLVGVWLKKDCLDLPDKRYETREAAPTQQLLNLAALVTKKSRRAIEALTLLRELSDGFQYQMSPTGKRTTCDVCFGKGKEILYTSSIDVERPLCEAEVAEKVQFEYDDNWNIIGKTPISVIEEVVECQKCAGEKTIELFERTLIEVPCPKDQMLLDELELHEDVGRFNIYGGFTGTIDRILKICRQDAWHTIRVDGRGWEGRDPKGNVVGTKPEELMGWYTSNSEDKICFVGQAGAAGMGLTLTASPTTAFFSNTYNGEDRQQTEARGHRIGMDIERGGRIVDFIHLESDRLIMQNLKKKQDLQLMSMIGLRAIMEK